MTAPVRPMPAGGEGPRIYNLFPLLAGPMTAWKPHLRRARQMGFNWIFLNPVQQPGVSGSIYSIRDYYGINPLFVNPTAGSPELQLRGVIEETHSLGMKIMLDLVINHTAADSPLVKEHPDWFLRDHSGGIVHPGAWENKTWITWTDLAAVDNAASKDRDSLWRYWLRLVTHYASLEIDGFRCDAAYQIPADLWRFLIGEARSKSPALQFFAETLGGTPEQTLETARAGFDFIFNSSKWWDFAAPWCLDQLRQTAPVVRSISFPESHDTERLATGLNGNRAAVRQRYGFAALFSAAVMIPIGFEFGFRRRLHVVKTRPGDWESPSWDDSDYIRAANEFKARYATWNEDAPFESPATGNPAIAALRKRALDGRQGGLLLINKDQKASQGCSLSGVLDGLGNNTVEISNSFESRLLADRGQVSLDPAGFRIYLTPESSY